MSTIQAACTTVTFTVRMAMFAACCVALFSAAQAQDIDEDELFSDTSSVVPSEGLVSARAAKEPPGDEKSLGISGEIVSAATGLLSRAWFLDGQHRDDVAVAGTVVGNLILDARLPRGVKVICNAEASVAGADSSAEMTARFSVRELFLDANIARVVYIRAGKQVLQWGRCFFWNPTDMLNVERKSFIDKIGAREGTLGLRTHAAFGTRANVYGFLDMHDTRSIDSLAGAAKAEVLLGGVESAVSVWGKKGRKPVFGFDMSFPVFGALGMLEASLTDGSNYPTVGVENGYLVREERSGTLYPRVSLGVMAILDFLGVDDRMNLGVECYYNGAAHSARMLQDGNTYLVERFPGDPEPVMLTKAQYFVQSGLYEENSNAMWYAAMFCQLGDIAVRDLDATLNAIMNINDRSTMVTGGLSYTTLHSLTVALSLTGFFGRERTEFSASGQGLMARLSMGVVF